MALICPIDQTENPDSSLFCSHCNAKLTRLEPGERSPDPRFVIVSRVREDSFSLSFMAEDSNTGRRYMLRELFPVHASDPRLAKQLVDTARCLRASTVGKARIGYPFKSADSRWYSYVELIHGITLRSELERAPMDEVTAGKRFRAVLNVLKELHDESLYHGNLSSDVVMLRDDGGIDLIESIYLDRVFNEGGAPPVASMVHKDIRDAGLLVLEMLDCQRQTGDLNKRLADVKDLALGAVLDYVFSINNKTPESVVQVEQLFEVLERATSAAGAEARDLYRQAYQQCGSGRFEDVLQEREEPVPPPNEDQVQPQLKVSVADEPGVTPESGATGPPPNTETTTAPVTTMEPADGTEGVKGPPPPLRTSGGPLPGPHSMNRMALAAVGATALCLVGLWVFMLRRPPVWNPSFSFSASPQTIAKKRQATLQWSVRPASVVQLNGEDVPFSGTRVVSPEATTTYRLVAFGPGGASQRRELTIQVIPGAAVSVVRFSGDRDTISSGEAVTLRWSTTGATRVRIEPGFDSLPPSGEQSVSPQRTTDYVLTADGDGGAVTSHVQVRVNEGAALAIEFFEAVPAASISSGAAVVLRWGAHGATRLLIEPEVGTINAASTFVTVHPARTTDYLLTAENSLGVKVSHSITVNVASAPTIEFAGDRPQIELGQPLRLHWSVTNGTHIRIEPGADTLASSGELIVYPPTTTEYRLIAEGHGGVSSKLFVVRVAPAIATFEVVAMPNSESRCRIWLLRWTVRGASSAGIEPAIGGVTPSSGYKIVQPAQTTRYVLKANGSGGSTLREVTVGGCTVP
jgi:hypothetical protein